MNATDYTVLFKALANEERLKIIGLLIQYKELCAQDVQKHFYLEQSTTSHHLNTLRRVGIIQASKRGRNIYYSMNRTPLFDRLDAFKDTLS